MPITFPLKLAVYWGAYLEADSTADELEFATDGEWKAYRDGLDEAEGWLGVSFVENPAIYVNKDGDFLERNGGNTKTSPKERYVIWGDDPGIGTRAETYAFGTEAEAEAFERGARSFAGEDKYYFVPDAGFKAYKSLAQAVEHLSGDSAQSLRNYINIQGYDSEEEDIFFVRADGALIIPDMYSLGDDPFNAPMDERQWNRLFNQHLRQYEGADNPRLTQVIKNYVERMRAGEYSRLPVEAAGDFAYLHTLVYVVAEDRPAPKP